jgi:glutaminase
VNRSIANLLESRGALSGDPAEAVDLYTRQSCLAVSTRDLATMGATLALGGVNPLTGERVVEEETCRHVLAVMTTAGLYENSGDWLYDVGLPGKSGIGGGIITVAPAKVDSPPLHPHSTPRATACADSLPHGFCRARSGSTSSCHGPKPKEPVRDVPGSVWIARRPIRRTRRPVGTLSP